MTVEAYNWLLWAMIMLAPIVFVVLLFIQAPYGRYARDGWGPAIGSRTGWLIMEAPASLVMLAVFFLVPVQPAIYVLLLVWQIHYFHRAFVYPFSIRSARRMPVLVVVMAIVFNLANAVLNGWHFVLHADWYELQWLMSVPFVVGSVLFIIGFYITKRSDGILKALRAPNETGYKIPRGFLYRWISCPNYFGESVQWLGWAIMTQAPAAWVFVLWTLANLVPRAISHHRWYRMSFDDYPRERKAFLPYLI